MGAWAGTRSTFGHLEPWKDGGFAIAGAGVFALTLAYFAGIFWGGMVLVGITRTLSTRWRSMSSTSKM